MIIYALIDPRTDRIRYIGKTCRTAHRRLRRHLAECYLRADTHKDRWLRVLLALGMEPKIEILESCRSKAELSEAEIRHIAALKSTGEDLTNATPGGDGGGYPHSEESKLKIKNALLGKPKSAEHRLRSGMAQRGRKASEETRAKLRAAHSSRPRARHSEQHCIAMSRGRGATPFIDSDGNRYETQRGCARKLGINVGHLNEVLSGKRGSVMGMKFTFLDADHDIRVREFPEVANGSWV